MRLTVSQVMALGVSICWLLCGQQVRAGEPTIVYTVLTNPSPSGLFPQEFGVPVYGRNVGDPFSVLPIDVNGDGTLDYRVLAPFGGNLGFVLEGMGENAVWTRPTGGNDVGGFVRPVLAGTQIGETLPTSDEWMTSWRVAWNTNLVVAPTFSAYSSISGEGIGLFRDMTAYAGLRFVIGTNVHNGWLKVQEIPWLGGGGIVYSFAYETRPNTPIIAGATDSVLFTATFSGANEIPPNRSTHSGHGSFTLEGNSLIYDIAVDALSPISAGIFGPAGPDSISRHLITNLALFAITLTNANGFPPIIWPQPDPPPQLFIAGYLYRGQVTLNEKLLIELLAGRFYVNLTSAAFPHGEIRGAILPAAPIQCTATFSGANEIPRNTSRFHGVGTFTLTGNKLAYHLALDAGILPLTAGIYGCPPPRTRLANLISPLDISIGVLIPAGGITGEPGAAGQVLYRGEVNLDDQEVLQLKRGELSANFFTSRYPRGEVSGQILPTDADQDGVPDYINDLIEQFCPCEGPWNSHVQYVAAVRDVAAPFAAERLITIPQFLRLVRDAQRSNCGK